VPAPLCQLVFEFDANSLHLSRNHKTCLDSILRISYSILISKRRFMQTSDRCFPSSVELSGLCGPSLMSFTRSHAPLRDPAASLVQTLLWRLFCGLQLWGNLVWGFTS